MGQQIVATNFNQGMQTNNATQQTLQSYTPAENSSGYFLANFVVRRLSDGATKKWGIKGVYKRTTGNTTLTVDLVDTLGTSTDLLALILTTATLDTSGADIRMRISGLISTDMEWYGEAIGQEMQII